MTRRRLLPALALTAVLLLPPAAVLAQADPEPSASTEIAAGAEDTRLEELEALVPESLAGLPLRENLQLATGEELSTVMSEAEAALLTEMLEANGRTVADYAAGTTFLPISDTNIAVIQAHRVTGIDAAGTLETWLEILSQGLAEPQVELATVAGREATLVSDATTPEVPLLYLFPDGDVIWMVVTADEAMAEEAVTALPSDDGIDTGEGEGGE